MRTEPSFSVEPEDSLLSASSNAEFSSSVSTDSNSQSMPDYLQYFGLSVEPFVDDPHFPFYPGGQRRQILEQLLHLCHFSQNLLVVVGDYGVGKTRMVQALIDGLDDADDICFLEGQINSDINSLLADVSAQFDLPSEEAFNNFSTRKTPEQGLLVLIVDNAHHLNDETIRDLLIYAQEDEESRLHLVLFAEPLLLNRLKYLAIPNMVMSDFLLEKFSLDEAVDYLNFRMEMADYLGPEIFSSSKVESWWKSANGQLLTLHEFAQEKLLDAVSGKAVKKNGHQSAKLGLPMPHMIGAAVLLGLLIMVGVYWGLSPSEEAKTQVVTAVELPKPTQSLSQVPQNPVGSPDASAQGTANTVAGEHVAELNANPSSSLPAEPLAKELAQSNTSDTALGQSAISKQSSATSTLVADVHTPVTETLANKTADLATNKSEKITKVTANADTVATGSQMKSKDASVVKQSVVPLVDAHNLQPPTNTKVQSSSAAPAAKENKRAVSSVDADALGNKKDVPQKLRTQPVKSSYTEQENTILGWSESSYTLQLVGLSSEKAVQDFLSAQPNKKELLVFKSLRNGKDWFVVVSGKYPSSASARQAIQTLPDAQKKASPWPREVKLIQKEIKQR